MQPNAIDDFRMYYTEKIWNLIPAIYRLEDGQAGNPGVLRSVVEVIAEQAAVLRRSQDRLWEDQFIDWCDDWAVPYIGDLLGTRLVSVLLTRARRIDVAKTIYYRRRKGTVRVLEELISDISQWDGKLVEGFQRLARARHGLDPQPSRFAGLITGTMPGGFADLRSASGSELTDGPFEEYYRIPDMRRPNGLGGRFGISKLDLYLYRLRSYPVTGSTAFSMNDGLRYLFDPSGRDIPLFAERQRFGAAQWDRWRSAREWELPLPIRCRLLGQAAFLPDGTAVTNLLNAGLVSAAAGDELRTLNGYDFRNEQELRVFLSGLAHQAEYLTPATWQAILKEMMTEDSGLNRLVPQSLSAGTGTPVILVEKESVLAARLEDPAWAVNMPPGKTLAVDAEHGRFRFGQANPAGTLVTASYHYGFSGDLGAGTYDRRTVESSVLTLELLPNAGVISNGEMIPEGVVQINNNRTYLVQSDNLSIKDFTLQARNQCRPYILLQGDLTLSSGGNQDARLVLDGLWIGSEGGTASKLIIKGDFESVTIRNCTIDPGLDKDGLGRTIFPVELFLDASIETLCIENSILGPVIMDPAAVLEDNAVLKDCIIQAADHENDALVIDSGQLCISSTTIMGKMSAHRLYASELLLTGEGNVADTQNGCFRFSAAPSFSRLPRPYESYLFPGGPVHWFVSERFGQPGYGQMNDAAPPAIVRGGENGAETGAFNRLLNALKQDGLRSKIDEYMPFGLIPAFIHQT